MTPIAKPTSKPTFLTPAVLTSKFTFTLLVCGTLAVTQGLMGCSRSDDKKTKKMDTTQTETKSTALDCASPATAGSIQQYLTKQIAQQATNTIQQLGQQANINVANVSMDNLLAQLMVNVQNIKPVAGQADQCQGKVSVTIPANDIANANQMAASLNQPTLAQRLRSKGLSLENNTIIADNAAFKVANSAGNYQVTSVGADTIINEVSNVLANSQLKQMMIQNAPTLNSNANPANNAAVSNSAIATGAAVAGAAGTAAVVHHAKKHSNTHTATSHPKAAQKPTKTVKSNDDNDTDDTPKKVSTEKATPKTLTDSSTKTVTTKTISTEKTPIKTTTTTTEKTTVKPQAVPNDATKLTIEQRNEKY